MLMTDKKVVEICRKVRLIADNEGFLLSLTDETTWPKCPACAGWLCFNPETAQDCKCTLKRVRDYYQTLQG